MICQFAVVHDLQKNIEQVAMGLFDFVEQKDAMRVLVNAIRQQAALVKPNVTGRCANQP